jgi:hypothetical protein
VIKRLRPCYHSLGGTPWDGSALGEAIATWHPHPFQYVAADEFADRVSAARRQVAGGDRSLAVVELMRLAALLGDRNGHTAILPADDHPDPLHLYPIAPYEFEDGVFVVASATDRDLVGFELEAVAGVPCEELLAQLEPLVARDNEWTVRARRPLYLVTAEVLRGVLQASDSVPIDLCGRCGSVRVVLDPVPAGEWYTQLRDAFPTWDARLPRRTELMFRGRREGPHWLETIRDGEVAYIAYEVTRGDLTGFACASTAAETTPPTGRCWMCSSAPHTSSESDSASSSVDRRSQRRCSWSSISSGERRQSSSGNRRAAHLTNTATPASWCWQIPGSSPTLRP